MRPYPLLLVGLLLLFCSTSSVRGNVYATDIRFNGSLHAGVIVPASRLTISYILNENATGGVSVRIYAGANVVKTFAAAGGLPGTDAGLNSFQWDGINDNGSNALPGIYTLSITAAADGYKTWTNITDDSTNFDVFYPTSIAVNRNTNSSYYGRVFIGNALTGGSPPMAPGILKSNADGSPADEGGFGTGGYPWSGGGYYNPSPWKMAVSADDRLYVDDWSGNGVVLSFDQVLSTNYLPVLRADNYRYPGILLSGPCVLGAGINTQIWMADINPASLGGLGVLRWNLTADGTLATNDTGTVIVGVGEGSDLTYAPFDVAVGTNGRIYVIQLEYTYGSSQLQDTDPTTMRVLCFAPYQNGSPPEKGALWKVGNGDPTLENAYGVAVNPAETFVAVASQGTGPDPFNLYDGGACIFDADNGVLVTNINQDLAGNTNQMIVDVAWDNVGNLYTADFTEGVWRVYSPPGGNQATTVAVPVIQAFSALLPAKLSNPYGAAGQLGFTLVGQSNVTYVIQQSPDLVNWIPVATNYSPSSSRSITLPFADNQDFYRAVTTP
jgi:hypothetical protein